MCHHCAHSVIKCSKSPFYNSIFLWSAWWHKFKINFFETLCTTFFRSLVFACIVTENCFDIFFIVFVLFRRGVTFLFTDSSVFLKKDIFSWCLSLGVKKILGTSITWFILWANAEVHHFAQLEVLLLCHFTYQFFPDLLYSTVFAYL